MRSDKSAKFLRPSYNTSNKTHVHCSSDIDPW